MDLRTVDRQVGFHPLPGGVLVGETGNENAFRVSRFPVTTDHGRRTLRQPKGVVIERAFEVLEDQGRNDIAYGESGATLVAEGRRAGREVALACPRHDATAFPRARTASGRPGFTFGLDENKIAAPPKPEHACPVFGSLTDARLASRGARR